MTKRSSKEKFQDILTLIQFAPNEKALNDYAKKTFKDHIIEGLVTYGTFIRLPLQVLCTDNRGVLDSVDTCLELVERIKEIALIINPSRYKLYDNLIKKCQTKIKATKNKIEIDTHTLQIKKLILNMFYDIHFACKKILENKSKSTLKIANLSEDIRELDLEVDNITNISKLVIDISVILEDLVKIFPEFEETFEIKFELPINNDLNYMVGGSAITSACKALRGKDNWSINCDNKAVYEHKKSTDPNSYIYHYINDFNNPQEINFLPYNEAEQILNKFGVYPALLHLILAVHVYRQKNPCEATFRLRGTDLIRNLGLDKRTDLSIHKKLSKVLEVVTAVRSLIITAKWTSSVKVKSGRGYKNKPVYFEVEPSIMWDILPTTISQRDLFGNEDLVDIEVLFRSGLWLKKFFNQADKEIGESLYNFATFSLKILDLDPYHEELALRIALLQCTMDYRQYYTVEAWLTENLEGAKDRICKAKADRRIRKKLTDLWDKTILALERIGYTVDYHETTYPEELRPTSDRKPRNYFERLLEAKVRLTPETLGKTKSELDTQVKAIEVKPLPQPQTYSGQKLKEARIKKANVTPKQLAKYLKCSEGKFYNAEKRENLTKKSFQEIMDVINFIEKHPDKF